MSYFDTLGFAREPFPNSPDPDLLYRSPNHVECLRHMEIAIRLRRGLNVVLGEVGTGKSTLCRELGRILEDDSHLTVRRLDDPYFEDPADFLAAVARLFDLDAAPMRGDQARLRETLKGFLADKAADGRHIVTLLVDEGQKITGPCLELLRELLNFESTTHKLLQIVIFAQTEFEAMLSARPNLDDRVNFHYVLRPLDFRQTRRMVQVRLALCAQDGSAPPRLFTRRALRRVYRLTGGYPRKIVRLCHVAMLLAVGYNRRRIGWGLIGRANREMRGQRQRVVSWPRRLALTAALGGLGAGLFVPKFGFDNLPRLLSSRTVLAQATLPPAPVPAPVGVTIPVDGRTMPAAPDSEAMSEAADMPVVPAAPAPVAPTAPAALVTSTPTKKPATAPVPTSTPATALGNEPPALPAAPVQPAKPLPQTALPEAPAPVVAPALAAAADEAPIIVFAPADAPADAPASKPAVAPVAALPLPEALGTFPTPKGWSASRQANRIYGAASRRIIRALAAANPKVDLERLRAGQSLTFPAIKAAALPAGACLVSVARADTLQDAFAALTARRGGDVPLVVFVTFQPATGLHFEVVEDVLHADAASAEAALVSLPPRLAATARLVKNYPQGTVYFTEVAFADGSRPSALPAPAPRQQVAVRETR